MLSQTREREYKELADDGIERVIGNVREIILSEQDVQTIRDNDVHFAPSDDGYYLLVRFDAYCDEKNYTEDDLFDEIEEKEWCEGILAVNYLNAQEKDYLSWGDKNVVIETEELTQVY